MPIFHVMNQILYDNNCHFCRKIKYILSNLDFLNYFVWIPNYNYKNDKQNPYIDNNSSDISIIVISSSKEVYVKYYACRYIMMRLPIFWPILPLLYLPVISPFIGEIIYKTISRNRYFKSH